MLTSNSERYTFRTFFISLCGKMKRRKYSIWLSYGEKERSNKKKILWMKANERLCSDDTLFEEFFLQATKWMQEHLVNSLFIFHFTLLFLYNNNKTIFKKKSQKCEIKRIFATESKSFSQRIYEMLFFFEWKNFFFLAGSHFSPFSR